MKNRITKAAQSMLRRSAPVAALALGVVGSASADVVTVPATDYSGVLSAVVTAASAQIASNAPGIIIITIGFAIFGWLRTMMKRAASGK